VISGSRDGIYFSFASGNSIDSNVVTHVRYGLHYMYSDNNRFRNNRFSRNAAGAAIMFSNDIELRENEFSEHVGYRAYGILLQTASRVLVERNTLSGNLIGVFLDNSFEVVLRDNLVTGNGIGIDLLPSASRNTFTGNSFAANRTPVRIARGSGKSIWSVDGRGNYWGRSAAFDLNGDGIGDAPLRVGDAFATLAQSRTALEVFTGTPAARALSWAEEAFPAFQSLRVLDPAPLVRYEAETVTKPAGKHVVAGLSGTAMTITLAALLLIPRRRRLARALSGGTENK
jgi:nitrous oxidase accessory protein